MKIFKKLSQNKQGIVSPLIIILAVVVIAGIGFAGWKISSNKKATPKTDSVATVAVSSSCYAQYHDNNICHFASNSTSFDKTSYTATITTQQSGQAGTITLENDGKGNTKLSTTSNGTTINSITLDGVTYIQSSSSGPWIKYPTGTSSPASNPTSSMNIGVGSSGITFKYIGTSSCGSLTCFEYQVSDSSQAGTTQYVWFDNSSYKLREWKYTDSSGNTSDMTISYGSVNITTPSPVESLSALTE